MVRAGRFRPRRHDPQLSVSKSVYYEAEVENLCTLRLFSNAIDYWQFMGATTISTCRHHPNSINIYNPNAAIRALRIVFVELVSRPRSDKEMQHIERTKNCKVFVLQDTSHLCLDNCETSNLGSASNHSLMWHISDQHCCEMSVV